VAEEFKYLAIKNWEKYQSGKKGWDWIKDYVNQDDDKDLAALSMFERGLLQELRRVRGRSGKNIDNDVTHIARAIHAKGTDRPHIRHALDTLIARNILVPTNQQVDSLEERRGEEKRGDIKAETETPKPPIQKPQVIRPETSSGLKAVMFLPLNSGEEFAITEEDFKVWKESYQAVDILKELRAMVAWLHSNPTKKKTRSGVKRFVNSWLSRAQDSPKTMFSGTAARDGPTVDATATIRERQDKLKAFRASNGQA
jgi:hypothetical protein